MAVKLTQRKGRSSAWGTINEPLPLQLLLRSQSPPPVILDVELGHAVPSTTVYEFTVKRRAEIEVRRVSQDPNAVYVSVALTQRDSRRRVGPLVTRQDGRGDSLIIPAGTYLIVAALDLAETVAFQLEVYAKPPPVYVRGLSVNGSPSIAAVSDFPYQAIASNEADGSTLEVGPDAFQAIAANGSTARAELITPVEGTGILAGRSSSGSTGEATVSPFFWVDRRGRRMGANVRIEPRTYNERIWRRADYELLLEVTDEEGDPIDLSSATVTVAVHDGRRMVLYCLAVVDEARLASGVIAATIDWEATVTMPERVYMDVLLVDGDGLHDYPVEGVWQLEDGVTE
jgi:hypothetical protein